MGISLILNRSEFGTCIFSVVASEAGLHLHFLVLFVEMSCQLILLHLLLREDVSGYWGITYTHAMMLRCRARTDGKEMSESFFDSVLLYSLSYLFHDSRCSSVRFDD